MKKLIFLSIVSMAFAVQAFSQAPATTDPFELQMRVYRSALKNYDLQAATIALYNMQAIKPERTDLNDSLALLYFAGERYAQAYLIGEEIVKNDPKRKDMLELVAVSKQNLGLIKESLDDYQKLYDMDKSMYYLYQMATLQYQLKRYGECVASLDQIIGSPDADKQKVSIHMQGGSQEVAMKAAAYNVKGICAMEMNQKDAAKENFSRALQVDPEFALAKGNLSALEKQETGAKTGGATPAKTTAPAPTKTH
ncbi:MAG TPA: hypothetical protein VG603_13780 [Chitinophagales bacterium]|nr:hypothetical protein [Chitinophagales bacterium]